MDPLWPTYHDLVVAYKSSRLHKPASRSQIQFEARLAESLSILLREIQSGRYRPSPSKCFVVTQPKPREIFAADFRDRVVHHLVVSQLEPLWEKKFIHSSFACRRNKGTHGAIRYAQQKVRELSQGGNKPVWALQLDLAKFFVSIDRPILCDLLLRHCDHPKLRELIQITYEHDARIGSKQVGNPSYLKLIPPGKSWFDQPRQKGIPIGNLSSQFGANVYLSGLDHFIQRELKPKAYLRYMDDCLLLDLDPEKLESYSSPIGQWLVTHRDQNLNPNKTHLVSLRDGISYLGYELRQEDSASQPLQVFLEPMKKRKWIKAIQQLENSRPPELKRPHSLAPFLVPKTVVRGIASVNAKLGSLRHGRSYLLRKESLEQFIKNTTTPRDIPSEFTSPWRPYKLKKGYRAIRLR